MAAGLRLDWYGSRLNMAAVAKGWCCSVDASGYGAEAVSVVWMCK